MLNVRQLIKCCACIFVFSPKCSQGHSEQQSRATARINGVGRTEEPVETEETASESARESVPEDDGPTSNGVLPGSIDWILSSGIDDPELLAKLR